MFAAAMTVESAGDTGESSVVKRLKKDNTLFTSSVKLSFL